MSKMVKTARMPEGRDVNRCVTAVDISKKACTAMDNYGALLSPCEVAGGATARTLPEVGMFDMPRLPLAFPLHWRRAS
jgi:hypothetical protein